MAIHCQNLHTRSGGFPNRPAECRICGIIRVHVRHISHLDDKEYIGTEALFHRFCESLQMACPSLGGSVREGADTIGFQSDPFDFQKAQRSVFAEGKIGI